MILEKVLHLQIKAGCLVENLSRNKEKKNTRHSKTNTFFAQNLKNYIYGS